MRQGGKWLESVLWSEVAPYKYANHTLQVLEACKVGHRHAYFVAMALQDNGYVALADKLHLMFIIMLYAPVYEVDVKGKLMSATAAVKSQQDHFNSGEWQELWADA